MSDVVRVVVADDSPFIRSIICSHLMSTDGFEIVGTAEDGQQAVDLVREHRPDVLTLDVDMPRMSGIEALEHIMRDTPTPVVMVSGVSIRAADTTLKAIKSGAADFVLKYVPGQSVDPETLRLDIISKVRAAASIAVVRTISRRHSAGAGTIAPAIQSLRNVASRCSTMSNAVNEIVVIGASTGGPIAIRHLMKHLPTDFAAPIVIVQHMPKPFTEVFAAQLGCQLPFEVKVVEDGDRLRPRQVYVAEGDKHLMLNPAMQFELHDGPPISGHRPSIDVTMKSIAQNFIHRVYGILLTGMGVDGASGLGFIKSRDGMTFAQSAETCVVNGMPKTAIEAGAAEHISSPQGIAERLTLEIDRAAGLRNAKAAMDPAQMHINA